MEGLNIDAMLSEEEPALIPENDELDAGRPDSRVSSSSSYRRIRSGRRSSAGVSFAKTPEVAGDSSSTSAGGFFFGQGGEEGPPQTEPASAKVTRELAQRRVV